MESPVVHEESKFRDFLHAFSGRWFTFMSGPLTVPFAVAAFFVPNAWVKTLFAVLAITCALFSSYWIWAIERKKVIAFELRPPSLDAQILELYVQKVSDVPDRDLLDPLINCDVFLHVKLMLQEPPSLDIEEYRLKPVLHGNPIPTAWFTRGLHLRGLITHIQKMTDAVGFESGYKVTELPLRLKRRDMPVEGWLHFLAYGLRERDIPKTVYRLYISTHTWSVYAETTGDKNLASGETRFTKLPDQGKK